MPNLFFGAGGGAGSFSAVKRRWRWRKGLASPSHPESGALVVSAASRGDGKGRDSCSGGRRGERKFYSAWPRPSIFEILGGSFRAKEDNPLTLCEFG